MAKYIYADHCINNVKCDFAQNLYHEHLKILNGCYEEFPRKVGFEDYKSSFREILLSIEKNGFDSSISQVPVHADDTACATDGGHRIAAALVFNKPLTIKVINRQILREKLKVNPDIYGYEFFQKRGLSQIYLDAMATTYCQLKKECFLVFLFPSVGDHIHDAEKILQQYGSICYKKEVSITQHGALNLLAEIYANEGWKVYAAGTLEKRTFCFPKHMKNVLKVYLFQADNITKVQAAKNNVRALCGSHHTIHTTDTHAQTLSLARVMFNQNSIHLINHRQFKIFSNFERFFSRLQKWMLEKKINNDCICIDSSAILSIYGMRDCNDIDLLHHGYDKEIQKLEHQGISSHASELKYHGKHMDEIIYNPKNYFWYKNIKCISLDGVQHMKRVRNEKPKDINDIALIDYFLMERY